MNFETFLTCAKTLPANYSLMIRGDHGIGKSECVFQLGTHFNLKVIDKRLSQMGEGDMSAAPGKKKPMGTTQTNGAAGDEDHRILEFHIGQTSFRYVYLQMGLPPHRRRHYRRMSCELQSPKCPSVQGRVACANLMAHSDALRLWIA